MSINRSHLHTARFFYKLLWSCVFVFSLLSIVNLPDTYAQSKIASEDDLKKTANKNFEDENYAAALPLYSQLLSLYPKDAAYNYRFGVCNLYAGKDKTKPISFLEFAAKDPSTDKEVFYHLGRAYHLNYKFGDALNNYNLFKQKASPKSLEKFDVNQQIQMCKNGLALLQNIRGLSVMDKKDLREADYFRAYELSKMNAKVIVKPDEYKTVIDKKKKESSVIVSRPDAKELFFSSYGELGKTGKDIYKVQKQPDGKWSKPINVGAPINTPFDEDYPYLHPDGHTFYFCSKGHTSMGGFDVFRCEYDSSSQTFTTPVNVDFPISSTDDDILYISDLENQTAFFSSKRISGEGEITIYKVKVVRDAMALALVKGTFSGEDETKHPKAKLTVTNADNGKQVGVFNLKEGDGKFTLYLPTGSNYAYKLESLGYVTQNEIVSFPEQQEMITLYQKLILKKAGGADKLLVENDFKPASEEDKKILTNADVLRQQANMDVNYNPNQTKVVAQKKDSVKTPSKKLELIKEAENNVKTLQQINEELKQQNNASLVVASERNAEAEKTTVLVNDLEKKMASMTDEQKKNEADKLKVLRTKQVEQAREALMAYTIAKEIENKLNDNTSAIAKEKVYLAEIKQAEQNKDNASFDKAVAQHTKLTEEQLKGTDLLVKNLAQIQQAKTTEINKLEASNATLKKDIEEIKAEAADLQKQADASKDKDLKTSLNKQIFELNEEANQKQKVTVNNTNKIADLNNQKLIAQNQAQIIESNKSKTSAAPLNTTQLASLNKQMEEYKTKNILERPILVAQNTNLAVNTTNVTTTTKVSTTTVATTNANTFTTTQPVAAKVENAEAKQVIDEINAINTKYEKQLVEANNNPNTTVKEEQKIVVTENWNKEIITATEKITQLSAKNNLSENDKKVIEQTKITANAKVQENGKIAQESKTQLASLNTSPTENTNKAVTASLTGTPKNKVKQADTAIAKINVVYQDQINKTNSISDAQQKQAEQNKIIAAWNNDLQKVNEQLQQIQNSSDLSAEEKTNLQKSLTKINEQTVANSNTVKAAVVEANTQKTDSSQVAAFKPNDSEINTALATNYSNNDAKAELKQSEKLLKEKENYIAEAVSLEKKSQKVTDTKEKKELAVRSKQMSEQAKEKSVDAQEANSIANEIQVRNNTQIIENYIVASKQSETNKETATQLNNESKLYFNEAFKLIVDAESTSNLEKKEELYKKAAGYEKVALSKQQNAIQILKKEDSKYKATVVPETADNIKKQREQRIEQAKSDKKQLAVKEQNKKTADSLRIAEQNKVVSIKDSSKVTIKTTILPFDSASVAKVEKTKDFTNYVALKNEAKNVENKSAEQKKMADEYKAKSNELATSANDFDEIAKATTNAEQKKEAQQKATVARNDQKRFATMSDSLTQLADNSSKEAVAKNTEAETFLQQLDKDLYEKAVTAYNQQNNNATTNSNNTTASIVNINPEKPIEVAEVTNDKNELKTDKVFEKAKTPVYSSAKPIPINPKLPSGIVFKVQIGAFRNPIPADLFQGFNPVMGETTPNGITRYTAGFFKNFESANQARREINTLGYRDAFVVAFCNGKRIPVEQAQQYVRDGVSCDGTQLANNTSTNNTNIANNTTNNANTTTATANNTVAATNNTTTVNNTTTQVQATELNKMQGLVYTVQVGVYARPVTTDKLFNIIPLYVAVADNGYLRYSCGIYNNTDAANQARNTIVNIGIKDAFVVAYFNGKRISVAEAKQIEAQQGSAVFTTAAAANQQPSRGNGTAVAADLNKATTVNNTTTTVVKDTAKVLISYKVQIGAFKEEVPLDKAKIFFNLSLKGPISNYVTDEKVTIFTFGNFDQYEAANSSKDELIKDGLADAFVVAYKNGTKITIEEAKRLNGK